MNGQHFPFASETLIQILCEYVVLHSHEYLGYNSMSQKRWI